MIESQNTTNLADAKSGLALCDLHRINNVRVTAANWREHVHQDRNTDLEEFADGHDAGRELAGEMRDPEVMLELTGTLAASPVRFVQRLQTTAYLATHVDPDVPLAGFIEYIFGGAAGGLRGPYARGFVAGFASAARTLMTAPH